MHVFEFLRTSHARSGLSSSLALKAVVQYPALKRFHGIVYRLTKPLGFSYRWHCWLVSCTRRCGCCTTTVYGSDLTQSEVLSAWFSSMRPSCLRSVTDFLCFFSFRGGEIGSRGISHGVGRVDEWMDGWMDKTDALMSAERQSFGLFVPG